MPPTPKSEERFPLGREKIRAQLQRILNSPDFHATEAQRNFFTFVVSETLAGRTHEIKGYTVGTRVFGRSADFDPNTDPIVSIHANRLRRALERYYLTAGNRDAVIIDIPKGTYVPVFLRHIADPADASRSGAASRGSLEEGWPKLLIRPFENLTGAPEKDFVGAGLATELAVEIARFQEAHVIVQKPEGREQVDPDRVARFIIDGNIRQDTSGIKVAVSLTDTLEERQVWADMHRCGFEASSLIEFQEDVARAVAAKISGERGIISRTLSTESKNTPPSELKTYEALLRYYDYDQSFTAEAFSRALAALERAAGNEPECGQVWSMLGRLYGNIYSFDIPGFENPLEKALEFAQRGVRLNPDNQRARTILAYVLMFDEELAAALAQVETALALNPHTLFMMDGLGYLLTLLGEWERGTALIRDVMNLNPYYGLFVHYALWVDWVRQGEFDQAHVETANFRSPDLFWEPLMKASTLGLLGRIEEGRRSAENLLAVRPDFQHRGRALIRHYIKFDDIANRIMEGLHAAGVDVD